MTRSLGIPCSLERNPAATAQHIVSSHDTTILTKYHTMIRWAMIRSFRGRFAEAILRERAVPKGFPSDLAGAARRKLIMVNNATRLSDLLSPPGNRLEALRGSLAGRHSIRVNDQWRIVFRWAENGPENVEIVDYH